MKDNLLIAISGNPNAGKTTLFNALTGAHHHVGNYPGVTVEKREGTRQYNGITLHFVDLPGIYSLTAYSEDEVVSRDFLLNEKPDLIIDVLDSTNLQRNLNLYLQMRELDIPVIAALNMSDEAARCGIIIDEKAISAAFDSPFVKTTAHHSQGINTLLEVIKQQAADLDKTKTGSSLPDTANHIKTGSTIIRYAKEIEEKLETITAAIANNSKANNNKTQSENPRWLAIKLLEKDEIAASIINKWNAADSVKSLVHTAINEIETQFGKDSEIVISEQRYSYIYNTVQNIVKTKKEQRLSITEVIDKFMMNRFLALPLFFGVLWAVFQLTFTIGAYPQEWLETFFGFLSDTASEIIPPGLLNSLVVDGIIGGVGGVLSFVPLIVILFFFLSILDDLGYTARAAFAADKLLHTFGLHGQSIFPLMLGFGCSVPAVMSSRTLKSKRDRIITVLVTPMMSCGAKLPIHLLLAGAFFGNNAGNIVMLIYLCGIALAFASALVLRNTVLRGAPTPFVMELPPYRLPTLRGVLWHVWEKISSYISRAGLIIMAASILIWALTTFPRYELPEEARESAAAAFLSTHSEASEEEIEGYISAVESGTALEHSIAGHIGKIIEPVFTPLGFNWRMSVSILPAFAAKEIVVSTLGVLYRVGGEETEENESLRDALAADTSLSPLTAFVFMLFMLIIPPCFAALATIKAELGWKWLGFECAFLLTIGWLVSFVVYQIGMLI